MYNTVLSTYEIIDNGKLMFGKKWNNIRGGEDKESGRSVI